MRVNYYFLVVWRCEETLLPPRANGSRLPRETRSWKTGIERFRRLLSLEYCARFAFGWKIAVGKKSAFLGQTFHNVSCTSLTSATVRKKKFLEQHVFQGRVRLGYSGIRIYSAIYSDYSAPGSRIAGVEIQVFRNEDISQTNAYSHSNSYSGLIPNERASNFAGD